MRFFVVKNAKLATFSAIVLAVLVATFALCSPMIVYAARTTSEVPTIVIDAGHGGVDAGVVGKTTGMRESDLNLQIALLLGDVLKGAGYFVVYTRTNDTSLTLVKSDTRKRTDMFSRAKIINSAKADVVVSVHMNYFPSSSRRGAQVFFDRNDDASFRLATAVQNSLNEINLENMGREFSPLTAEKYILSCSQAASVIVECGFLSNPADERLLETPEYKALLAEKIAEGVKDFLKGETAG
ncbi:MAG: N-acetylmuramoyl-L-alanine amidase [Clostridia bacterium]|nr:N-acetylmuramoyl-L-alanine amidase [Clostridia bacterium]